MAQSDEQQRERIEALRELARQQGAEAPPVSQSPAPAETFTQRARLTKRSGRWRLPLIVGPLVAVIVGSGAWWLWQRQATQLAPIPAELALDLPSLKLFCPQALAWSPDGTRVAVQVSDHTCEQQSAHLLAIFDARQGKLLQRFDIDVILGKHGVTGLSRSPSAFGPPLWSPDGKNIAVPYGASQGLTTSWGALLLPLSSGEERIFSSSAPSTGGVVWDAQTGKALSSARTLPPALTYRVGSDGLVTSDQPAVSAGATPTYTGSPTSGELSRWRSGVLSYTFNTTPEDYLRPHAWYLKARLTAWASQNLLAVGFPAPSLLPGGTVIASECATLGLAAMCANPPLALPDRAFEAAYQQARAEIRLPSHPELEQPNFPVPVAWRPDGKVLATLLQQDGFYSEGSSLRVTLYDTASGQVIKTLTALRTANITANDDSIAPTYGSPAGTQLAFVDAGSNRVTIWGASSLPA